MVAAQREGQRGEREREEQRERDRIADRPRPRDRGEVVTDPSGDHERERQDERGDGVVGEHARRETDRR